MSAVENPTVKIVVTGHVDHGKSTLLGRLLLECDQVPDDKVQKVSRICADKGLQFEPAFLFDGFEEEQGQGVSIDTTRINLAVDQHRFLLIDAPGHIEFLRNMTSGASGADWSILVVDCSQGIESQTVRHLEALNVLGIDKVCVVLNKVDKVDYRHEEYLKQEQSLRRLLQSLGLSCRTVLPVVALTGENVARTSELIGWYDGPTLIQALNVMATASASEAPEPLPFRMVLQDVYKLSEERYFVGRVQSGEISVGKPIYFSPSNKVSQVRSIHKFPQVVPSASAGESIAVCLEEQIFVERGEVFSLPESAPEADTLLVARLIWFGREEFEKSRSYLLKIGTAECSAKVRTSIEQPIANGCVCEVEIECSAPVAFDRYRGGINQFVLCSASGTLAAGTITGGRAVLEPALPADRQVTSERGYVGRVEREALQGHQGAVVWITGLSGAGKTTLARAVERRLFESGRRAVAIDADNVRSGLCSDLGFSPEERSENIRRIAHVAEFLLSTGAIVIVACLSPYVRDRERARQIIGHHDFFEVYAHCPIEICQERDPKGLYGKVRDGKVKSFSGIASPYQPPAEPALTVHTDRQQLEEEVEVVLSLLKRHNRI